MDPISLSPLLKPTLDALKAGLRVFRRKHGKRKYEEALSVAIKELLQQHPDISAAEAQLAAARATGIEPDLSFRRGEQMLLAFPDALEEFHLPCGDRSANAETE